MNLILPLASHSQFFKPSEYSYTGLLAEIQGRPMIQWVIENLTKDNRFSKIIFIIQEKDSAEFHLDNTLEQLSPIKPTIIKLKYPTQGALCSVLFAIDYINSNTPLVIANADQIFEGGISRYIDIFVNEKYEAGCLTIESVHPRWSYIRKNEQGEIVQSAEKDPISKDAIAGLYMYKSGHDFVCNGISAIRNNAQLNNNYYISSVFNEYILKGKSVGNIEVLKDTYHSFYTPQKIKEFEDKFRP